jgi:uncharacterized protein (TIGR00730 family)
MRSTEFDFLKKPKSRIKEFINVLRIGVEFINGLRKLHTVGPCITVFGSARTKEEDPYYQAAVKFGEKIAGMGLATITGGGPGIMEAANKGAKLAGGKSIGCNIELPMEQFPNPYVDLNIDFKQFYIRKVILLKCTHAFIVLPGGFGTLDELFETITLIQTKKTDKFPIVLFGKSYWEKMMEFVEVMEKQGTIGVNDKDLFLVTDSVEEGINYVRKAIKDNYQSKKK